MLACTTGDDAIADCYLQEIVTSVREASKNIGISGDNDKSSSTSV
jgi:hypothetical protein